MARDVYYKISDERKLKLLKPAIKEFVSKPFDKVTVLSLSHTMKILRTDFYYYFQDKEDIYNELLTMFEEKVNKENPEATIADRLVFLFNEALSLKGAKNRQFLLDITENFHPAFADEIACRYIDIINCDCEPEKKYIKCKTKMYKFMVVLNEYLKGRISKEDAVSTLAHKHCNK